MPTIVPQPPDDSGEARTEDALALYAASMRADAARAQSALGRVLEVVRGWETTFGDQPIRTPLAVATVRRAVLGVEWRDLLTDALPSSVVERGE